MGPLNSWGLRAVALLALPQDPACLAPTLEQLLDITKSQSSPMLGETGSGAPNIMAVRSGARIKCTKVTVAMESGRSNRSGAWEVEERISQVNMVRP